ncbi:tripartite tricarboxylate transporter substrate binding protein [Candidimonas humi]|uniref:Bug family tripartite tricarboxylate transporter substrate binding protein n=1 Tax=Candidimonas humi TaxID=683355 RepID=A0ABV8NYM1_9BURK|nr:tripartite tricarboxylate transporter substrate binding protein [Candidimonas humi]MBV6304407.1 tripartite tricarboxylate transporter substrate binding protein [Candidimonas humi]
MKLSALCALAASLLLIAPPATHAEATYPSKPIRLVVGYSPGGPSDILARQLAPALGKALGTAIIVENKPGANADIGGAYVAHADPDGYTLLLGDLTLATNPSLMRSMPFKPRTDLRAIAPLAVAPLALVVNMSVPAHNMKELLDYARANPDKLSEGTAGRGNLTHLAGEVLKKAAGVKIEQVPYKGSGPALTDLVGGHISMVITGVSSSKGFIKSGQVRALAITGTRRSASLPDVPTFSEATGLPLPELNLGSWWGLFGPAGLPDEVVAKLNAATQTILRDAQLQQRLQGLNIEADPGSAQVMAERLNSETTTWGKVIKEAGITPQ